MEISKKAYAKNGILTFANICVKSKTSQDTKEKLSK